MSDQGKELCACGSGLRAVRCCMADLAAWPLAETASLLDGQAADATKLFNDKKYVEAEGLALKILDLAPNHRMALRVLYEIRKAQSQHKATEALGARLAKLPGADNVRGPANGQFAQYLVSQGRHVDALPFAAAALKAQPRDATAHHVMGVVLTETGELLGGERHYRRALDLLGREDGLVLANLAWNMKLQGRLDEAAALYAKALMLRPDNKRGIGGQAQVAFGRGAHDEGDLLLDDALARWPEDRTLRLLKVMADLSQGRAAQALTRLGAPEGLMPPELLARGQAFMQGGQVAEAINAIATARRTQRERQGVTFQAAPLQARLDRFKAFFTADRVQKLPRAEAGPFMPVFLIGFPRAGSSLLEQLLAQLPGFAAGDELGTIAGLATFTQRLLPDAAEYPELLEDFMIGEEAAWPQRLRGIYEERRAAFGLARTGVRFITDRGAANAWHLGLIKLLYPEAPIIHVIRHPYDLLLSNVAQDRRLEGNAQVGLPALARYFVMHAEMIRHYRGQMALRYLPVRYEALVADPAGVLARVLAFIAPDIAVPQNVAQNNLAVADPRPAHFALRAPVHGRAAGRYRAYRDALPKLFSEVDELLRPWVEELGYKEEQGA